jgi:UDP-3-O-[3-hydroxymyristoyl] glucosamine N-acyltransferase
MEFTAGQLAEILNGKIEGDEATKVSSLSKIDEGEKNSISFLYSTDYLEYLYTTQASVVIISDELKVEKEMKFNPTLIRVDDARMAFAKLLEAYKSMQMNHKKGIHPSAVIEEDAEVGENTYIGPQVYVGHGAKIGSDCQVNAHAVVAENVRMGNNCVIHHGVRILEDSVIGDNCTIQSGAVIGGDGFGFQPNSENNYHKIMHVGNVILEDNVEIGVNTTIDKATFGSTIIRKGVKLDNLIQVGHNCEIGENTVIAAQSGVAGSVKIGKNCMIGGQVGFAGHQKIADGVKIAAQSGIQGDIENKNEIVQGSPALNIGDYKRSYVIFRQLPKVKGEVSELRKEIKDLKNKLGS